MFVIARIMTCRFVIQIPSLYFVYNPIVDSRILHAIALRAPLSRDKRAVRRREPLRPRISTLMCN